MKIFGCLCFVSTIAQGRKKLYPRAQPAVFFLGYPHGQKAYKIFYLVTQKIIISRDIIFHEYHFPCHISTNFSSPYSRFYLPTHTNIPFCDFLSTPPILSPSPVMDFLTPHAPPDQVLDLTANPSSPTPPRKSTRTHKLPSYLQDYYCHSTTSHTHWCNLIHTSSFSS